MTKLNNSSVIRALDDRLSVSEAIEVVRAIIEKYPHGGKDAGRGYIGSLAAILGSYPRSISVRAPDPLRGVVAECDFLPTPSRLLKWCEAAVAPLREDAEREMKLARQLEERAQREAEPPPSEEVKQRIAAAAAATKMQLRRDDPAIRESAANVALNQAECERRRNEVVADWARDGRAPPTIAGQPITRELARILGIHPAREAAE